VVVLAVSACVDILFLIRDLLHGYGSGVGKWMDGDGDCCLVLAGLSLEAGDEGAREHQRA
jgi:hypothetical protein